MLNGIPAKDGYSCAHNKNHDEAKREKPPLLSFLVIKEKSVILAALGLQFMDVF